MEPITSVSTHETDTMITLSKKILVFFILIVHAHQAIAEEPLKSETEQQYVSAESSAALRLLFTIKEKELEAGIIDIHSPQLSLLKNYPLYPYLEAAYLERYGTNKALKDFLSQHSNSPYTRSIKRTLINRYYQQQNWPEFIRHYRYSGNEKRHCKYLSLLWQQGPSADTKDQVYRYWLHGKSRHADCDQVFDAWAKSTKNFGDKAWRRIQLAINQRQYGLAAYLKRFVSRQQARLTDEWIELDKKETPKLNLKGGKRELGVIYTSILKKYKWDNPDYIISYLKEDNLPLTLEQVKSLQYDVALSYAVKQDPKARYWLLKSLRTSNDKQLAEWFARFFLYQQDWDSLSGTIHQYALFNKSRWKYWLAISLSHQKYLPESTALLEELAKERSYYGFLAAVQLKQSIALNEKSFIPDQKHLAKVAQVPAIRRAQELFLLDRHYHARREWFHALKVAKGEDYPYLAQLAYDWGWYDRAISLLSGGEYHDVINMRFPTAKQPEIITMSEKHAMPVDWISAIIRQESAYRPDARSPVGALGLMQLMPATARATYKELYQSRLPGRKILEPTTNIDLGTYYLGKQYQTFNHFAPATAAYNVGPHRVKRWLTNMPKESVPAPVWIETMPWKETRHYVKNVAAFRAIYARLNNMPTTFLSELLTSSIGRALIIEQSLSDAN